MGNDEPIGVGYGDDGLRVRLIACPKLKDQLAEIDALAKDIS
jgi:hypothetical protein